MSVKVSVCMTTYKQEPWVAQAVESVLAQETDFPFELVVADDKSPDRTPAVLAALAERHPDRIRLILREKNLGSSENFMQTFRQCRGEYVALIDGDDYWTRTDKLQIQVDYLDAHPEVSICGHPVGFVYDDDEKADALRAGLGQATPPKKELGDLKDAITIGAWLPTRSMVFRRSSLPEFPSWYGDVKLGDWALLCLNASKGLVASQNEVMAVQRIHAGGMWSSLDREFQYRQMVRSLRHYRRHFGLRYLRCITGELALCHLALADIQRRSGRKWTACALALKAALMQLTVLRRPQGMRRTLSIILGPVLPGRRDGDGRAASA